jgi:hypothetical protein
MSEADDHALLYDAESWVAARHGSVGHLLVLLLAIAVVGVAGCGSTVQGDSKLAVYVSAPTSGPAGAFTDGAEQALEDAGGEAGGVRVELVPLDGAREAAAGAPWSQAGVAANAREATQDSTSIGYIGELYGDANQVSVPITNEAGLLQVTPMRVPGDLLREPGGSDVPADVQTTGRRTFAALSVFPQQASPGMLSEDNLFDAGYESVASILDAIGRAEDPLSRADVVAAYLATTDRDSRLGTYTIGIDGAAIFSGPG